MALWPEIVAGALAGFLAGILGSLAERTLFSARESWKQARESGRFLRKKYEEFRGLDVIRCPSCLAENHSVLRTTTDARTHPRTNVHTHDDHYLFLHCDKCHEEWAEKVASTEVNPEAGG